MGLYSLALEAVLDLSQHVRRDRFAHVFPLVTCDEGCVFEFVGAGTQKAMTIDMRRQEQVVRLFPLRDQNPVEVLYAYTEFLQFAAQDTEKRLLVRNDGRLADQRFEDIEELVQFAA